MANKTNEQERTLSDPTEILIELNNSKLLAIFRRTKWCKFFLFFMQNLKHPFCFYVICFISLLKIWPFLFSLYIYHRLTVSQCSNYKKFHIYSFKMKKGYFYQKGRLKVFLP